MSVLPLGIMSERARLRFFRVMAFVVGFGLLLLVLSMVLRYGFHNDVLTWWAIPHGYLYMVYLVATALLGFAMRWGIGKMVLVMLAGCVPFLSFWVEHRISAETVARLERQQVAAR